MWNFQQWPSGWCRATVCIQCRQLAGCISDWAQGQAEHASGYVSRHWAHCPLGVCVLARPSALSFGRVMPQPFYPVTEHVFPASLLRKLNFCEFYLLCEKFYPKTMRNLLIEQSVIKEKFGFIYHILKYWIVFFKGFGARKSLWITSKLSYIIKWELHLTWTKKIDAFIL